MSVQNIRRALTLPPVPLESPPYFQGFVRGYIMLLAQQTNLLQSHIQTFDFSWGAVAAITVPLAVPFPTNDYGVFVSPNQNNGAIWFTALTTKQFTMNFGVVAAGTGMILAVSNS